MTTQPEPTIRGLWYEDFVIGEERVSPGRTVTEADIVNYASLTGDFSQMHTDEEYSKTTEYGTRIAHGMLGISLASALCLRTNYTRGTAVATLSWGEWRFLKPIYIGDTVTHPMALHGQAGKQEPARRRHRHRVHRAGQSTRRGGAEGRARSDDEEATPGCLSGRPRIGAVMPLDFSNRM